MATKKLQIQYKLNNDDQTYFRVLHDAHLPTWLESVWQTLDHTTIMIHRTYDNALVGASR